MDMERERDIRAREVSQGTVGFLTADPGSHPASKPPLPLALRYWASDDDAPIPAEISAPLRSLIVDTLDEFERCLIPAPTSEIVAIMARLAVHFPARDRTEAEWRVILEDFAEDLAPFPSDILRAAVAEYRRAGKFWPRPSEIVAIAEPALARRQRVRWRLRRALGSHSLTVIDRSTEAA